MGSYLSFGSDLRLASRLSTTLKSFVPSSILSLGVANMPVVLIDQVCLLKSRAIGQFLKIKYKLNPDVNIKNSRKFTANIPNNNSREDKEKILSRIMYDKNIPPTTANGHEYGNWSLVISLPSLFKILFSGVKLVLLKNHTNKDIKTNVAKKMKLPNLGLYNSVPQNEPIAKPKDMPNQKTKFQTLSLLSHFSCFSRLLELERIGSLFTKSCIFISFYFSHFQTYTIAKKVIITKYLTLIIFINILFSSVNVVNAITNEDLVTLIGEAERTYNIPRGLLVAISKTESDVHPFALGIQGRAVFPKNRDIALKTLKDTLSKGITNIDVGTMQVNYKWHHHNFKNLDEMINPKTNIEYAAKLLKKLKQEHGSWHKAVRYYHSSEPIFNKKYSRKVLMNWLSMI